MNRLLILILVLFSLGASPPQEQKFNFGWVPNRQLADKVAKSFPGWYKDQLNRLTLYSDDKESSFCYRSLFQVLQKSNQLSESEKNSRRLSALHQGDVGCCVGYATSQALDILMAADIIQRFEHEEWRERVNADAIYAIGRNEHRGGPDGSTGSWSVDGISKIGTLHRLLYGDEPGFDLRKLDSKNARKWANSGLSSALLKLANEHKVIACVRIESLEQIRASIQNNYPVLTCAMASYAMQRDDDGFARRTGALWAHAMAVVGYRSAESGREGYLIWNSWGDEWQSGGYYPEDQPMGSFWVSPQDMMFHIKQSDTWAIAGYQGFVARILEWENVF